MDIVAFFRWPRFLTAAALLFITIGFDFAAVAEPVRVERRLEMMGTRLAVSVNANSRADGLAAAELALAALEDTEARLSTWHEDTELSRLNASPAGAAFTMSPELRRDLEGARRWWLATDTAFDPAVGALTEAWGLRTGGTIPSESQLQAALKATGFGKLRFEASRIIRLSDVRIDEGGFGKGAGLDAALDALGTSEASSAILDLGGQVALFGATGPVEIQVAHPADREQPVLTLTVDHGSVATSGNSERPNHLLDPRTGQPATDFGSLTVWAPDALAADCLSTGLYVLGPDRALELAMEWPEVEVLVLETGPGGLTARWTPGLAERVQALAPGLRLASSAHVSIGR
jgi:thiamine biosynthesis lipoprotein